MRSNDKKYSMTNSQAEDVETRIQVFKVMIARSEYGYFLETWINPFHLQKQSSVKVFLQ